MKERPFRSGMFLLDDLAKKTEGNVLAEAGYSRDHHPDCKQVCKALVVTFRWISARLRSVLWQHQ